MLQRQLWHLQKRHCPPSLPLLLWWPQTQSKYTEVQQRCTRLSSTSQSLCNTRHASTTSNTSVVNHGPKFARQPASRHENNTRKITREPWVNVNSLPESLEAHRKANREGLARDGVPLKKSRRGQRGRKKGRSQLGPWVGKNTLHLTSTTSSQSNKVDYGGACPPLLSEWRFPESLPSRLRWPWLTRAPVYVDGAYMPTAIERLSAEMRACEQYFSPSPSEKRAAGRAVAEIKSMILQVLGEHTLIDLIGSRAAGNEGPVSDLDINVTLPHEEDIHLQTSIIRIQLRKINLRMRAHEFADTVLPHAYVRGAKVPIVVGTHIPSGLEFQIQSTATSYDTLEVSKAFMAEFPDARTLFKVVKQMLVMRGLNRGYLGGLTSYPLLNMIVTSLKLSRPPISAGDIATQLLHFLDFWSEFDFEKQKIMLAVPISGGRLSGDAGRVVDPISSIPKVVAKSTTSCPNTFLMSHEDPANINNDLGRSTYGIKHIQACFIEARASIQKNMQTWDRGRDQPDGKQDHTNILAWCLEGNYTSFEEARWQLNRYNEQIIT